MLERPNELRWQGQTGHYEVYYLTLTDPRSGIGVWIRYTMTAPLAETGEPLTCALWFVLTGNRGPVARKRSFPIAELTARADPFHLRIGEATLSDQGMSGSFDDVGWELHWRPTARPYEHVHPLLRRLGAAQTVLVLPHADLSIDGELRLPSETLVLDGARGAQAHIWGSKHANTWAWAHCNDFVTPDGTAEADAFIDAVSVHVSRMGREIGPNTPVVGRIDGEDFISTSPARVLANDSTFALTGWRFEAVDGRRKVICEVDADREQLAGVTYHDPDGELAYCYNGETASMRLHLYEKARRVGGWAHRKTLLAPGRAHFEYAQRDPIKGLAVLTQ